MMNRVATALTLLVVTATSCGGGTTAGSGTPSSPPASSPATTQAVPAAVLALNGEYEGSWKNTTFGSTGPITVKVAIADDGAYAVTIDIGGAVFGGSDPEPISFSGTYEGPSGKVTTTSPLLGSYTVSFDNRRFTLDAPDVPGARIKGFTATGTLGAVKSELVYTVSFEDGTADAKGTASWTKRA